MKGGRRKAKLDADLDRTVDQYEVSESDDDLSDHEKQLVNTRRGRKAIEPEEEVLGIYSSEDDNQLGSEEDDSQEEGSQVPSDFDSDIEGKDKLDPDIPDSRDWGAKKQAYYNTDYVDKDLGGFKKASEEKAAYYEEEEANAIQQRLMGHLDEADVTLGLLDVVPDKKRKLEKAAAQSTFQEDILTEYNKLSKEEKLELIQRQSPELLLLIGDVQERMEWLETKLLPVLSLIEQGKVPKCEAATCVRTQARISLNYSLCVIFYLMLQSKREKSDNHPVVSRLFTFRKLLQQVDLINEELEPQIESILESVKDNGDLELVEKPKEPELVGNRAQRRKRKLQLLEESKRLEEMADSKAKALLLEKGSKDKAESEQEQSEHSDDSDEESGEEPPSPSQPDLEDSTIQDTSGAGEAESDSRSSKRPITRQMDKNKGLTPRRKRENRNPRVKNRNKYRKAIIRRKGQVREPRKELDRYGGEVSGIKAYVTKAIKLK